MPKEYEQKVKEHYDNVNKFFDDTNCSKDKEIAEIICIPVKTLLYEDLQACCEKKVAPHIKDAGREIMEKVRQERRSDPTFKWRNDLGMPTSCL
jgi:hypothetical protein